MDYGARLKHFIDRAGTTPNALAKKVNLDPTTIYKNISNDSKPSIPSLERMCAALGITMAEFFADDEAYQKAAADLVKRFIAYAEEKNLPPEQRKAVDRIKSQSPADQQKTVFQFIKSATFTDDGRTEYEILDEKTLLEKYKSLPEEARKAVAVIIGIIPSSQR